MKLHHLLSLLLLFNKRKVGGAAGDLNVFVSEPQQLVAGGDHVELACEVLMNIPNIPNKAF